MLFSPLDIAVALEKFATDMIALHRLDKWARLVFTMAFSGIVSFLTTCGGAMAYPLHRPTTEAIGEGMISAAVMMTVLFRRSELTKGMLVALPAEEAKQEIHTDAQTISK